jgi:hypothetical protein
MKGFHRFPLAFVQALHLIRWNGSMTDVTRSSLFFLFSSFFTLHFVVILATLFFLFRPPLAFGGTQQSPLITRFDRFPTFVLLSFSSF